MLTHGDALYLIANARALLDVRAGDERLALLPMCHVMERVLGTTLLRPRPGGFALAELAAGEFAPAEPGAAATQDIDDFIGSLDRRRPL